MPYLGRELAANPSVPTAALYYLYANHNNKRLESSQAPTSRADNLMDGRAGARAAPSKANRYSLKALAHRQPPHDAGSILHLFQAYQRRAYIDIGRFNDMTQMEGRRPAPMCLIQAGHFARAAVAQILFMSYFRAHLSIPTKFSIEINLAPNLQPMNCPDAVRVSLYALFSIHIIALALKQASSLNYSVGRNRPY
jgi:hypothetical protein